MTIEADRAKKIKKLVRDPLLNATVKMKRPNKSDSFSESENRKYRKTISKKVAATRVSFYEGLES